MHKPNFTEVAINAGAIRDARDSFVSTITLKKETKSNRINFKMKSLHRQFLFLALFGLICTTLVSGQYDENSIEEDDEDDGERDARQVPYAARPPSRSCARVWYGKNWCGGFSSGTGGGCDAYCLRQGYEYSWCRPTYCLCHRGEDRGRECEVL